MGAHLKERALLAAFIILLSSPVLAVEQATIFNTKDFRQDRTLWTDYKNNTTGQLSGHGHRHCAL